MVVEHNYFGAEGPCLPHSFVWPCVSGTNIPWDTLEEVLLEDREFSHHVCILVELRSHSCVCVLKADLDPAAVMKARPYVWGTSLGT